MPPWGKTDAEAIEYLDAAHKADLKVEVGIPQEAVQVPGSADSPLGTVLDGIVCWSTELPFNDVFKTSGAWMSGTAENYDDHRPLDLDEHGWVRSLLPGQRAVTLMMWGSYMWIGGVHRVPAGRYTVEYEGEGTIEYNGASVVEHAPGRDVIELAPEPPDGGLALMITTTNPRNYTRNIRVLLPNARPGETFNPRFLESLRGYRLIRFLSWMVGPSPEHVDLAPHRWAARRTMQAARWDSERGGVPFEVMIDLANRLDIDAWFSIPHLADDAYVRGLAELLRDRLEPERKVYVEHANEVWNPMFSSNAYATKRGNELGLAESSDEWTRDYEAWTRYHARRTREIGAIFREVLGRDRVVVVLATQSDVPEISEALLGWDGTAADVDALATAAYFGYDVTSQDSVPLIERWTLDDLFHELESKTVPTMIDYIAQQAEIARLHGVRLVAYEAGQHLVRLDGDESPHETELFDAANHDPRMGPLYTRLITEWSRLSGGDILVHLMNCGQAGKAGRWGLIEYLGQPREEAPKYDAVMKWMEGGTRFGPTIKANGFSDSITVGPSNTVTITVAFDVGSYPTNVSVDWWVIASADYSAWYYMDSTLAWMQAAFIGNNHTVFHPVYQGALFDLPSTTVLPAMTLPPGTYYFWFAVDYPMDGILDPNGPILYDNVKVTVAAATTLKELAAVRGIHFGAFYQYDIRSDLYNQVFEKEMSAMTAGTFWTDGFRASRTEFDFSELDAKVNWGLARDMELYGQTLVWFEDIPDWLKTTSTSDVETVMNEHIDTVVRRYTGQIKFWNVVNEAVNDDGTLRQDHKWAEAMGNDYIRKAFIRAHAADPTAVLYYNDFGIESNQAKFEGVKALLISLKNQDVPVHALGWQMHVTPTSFDAATLLARMNEIADLGFDNYITELDVELTNDVSEADFEQQKQTYKTVVQTFLAARQHKTIVVWGLRDGDPWWLTDNHPLLFDENYRRKPAYFGVQEALQASLPVLSKLHVSGNRIVTKEGQEVRLRGVNFMDPFVLEKDDLDLSGDGLPDNHFAEVATDFARVKALGANVVRQTVYPGYYRLVGGDNYLTKYLDPMINLAEENGLYVIISYHVIGRPGGWYADADNMLAAYPAKVHYTSSDMAVEFWNRVATRYDNREYVLFEIYNESADQTADFTWDDWRPTGQLLIDTVRKHSDNIILGSGPYYTGDLSAVPTNPYKDSNLVYVAHTYPGSFSPGQDLVTEWERLFGFMTATYPVIVSEWGFNKNGDETTKGTRESFGRPRCNYLYQKNLHWVAYVYHPFDSEPPMLENDWKTLNEFGRFVKECLQSTPTGLQHLMVLNR